MLSKEEAILIEPLLRKDILTGGVSYYEYRTDDARLTIEILKKAFELGALAINYTKVTGFIYRREHIKGVKVKDLTTGTDYEVKGSQIINAGGPWVDEVSMLDNFAEGKKLHLTKGVHLVVDYIKLPLRHSVYFDVPDGRMIFAIPREGKTYIGTTDTDYYGKLEEPEITAKDRDYLLKACNSMFPGAPLSPSDVESGWAGLRPLVKGKGESPSAISRKDELFVSKTGLITIAGGKLTGYRKMAQRATNVAALRLEKGGKDYSSCSTKKIKLSGGDTGEDFEAFAKEKTQEGVAVGLPIEDAAFLAKTYGSNTTILFNYYKEAPYDKLLQARLQYAIEHEMAATLSDYFIRRTGGLYFNIAEVKKTMENAANNMAKLLSWSDEQKQLNIKELEGKINAIELINKV